MVVYAGPLKQRLGPLKARMKQYNGIAHRLLEAPSSNLKEVKLTKERLLQSTDTLEKINFQWASLISEQDRQDQDAWQKDYEAHAVGDDGFIFILDQAKDYLAQLVVYLDDINPPSRQTPAQNRISSNQNMSQGNIQQNNVNLPKCNIPIFTGHKTEWPTFWSIFKISVDENAMYSNSEKMAYLMSTVSKNVGEEIRGYQLTDNGYELAIKHLKARFGDPQFIKRALFKEIDHLPKAVKVPEVRRNWSELNRILLQLKNLGEDIESTSIIREIERKFGEWVLKDTSKEELDFTGKWTAEKMLENVDKIVKIREMAYDIDSRDRTSVKGRSDQHAFMAHRNFIKSSCIFCSSTEHFSAKCRKFSAKKDRINKLIELERCLKCLKNGHIARNCDVKIICKTCRQDHHQQALCPNECKEEDCHIVNQEYGDKDFVNEEEDFVNEEVADYG